MSEWLAQVPFAALLGAHQASKRNAASGNSGSHSLLLLFFPSY
jgi:hypothetical protein